MPNSLGFNFYKLKNISNMVSNKGEGEISAKM